MQFLAQWFSGEGEKMLQVGLGQFIFKKYIFYIYKNVLLYIHSAKSNNLFWIELLISTLNAFVSLSSIPNNRKP